MNRGIFVIRSGHVVDNGRAKSVVNSPVVKTIRGGVSIGQTWLPACLGSMWHPGLVQLLLDRLHRFTCGQAGGQLTLVRGKDRRHALYHLGRTAQWRGDTAAARGPRGSHKDVKAARQRLCIRRSALRCRPKSGINTIRQYPPPAPRWAKRRFQMCMKRAKR